MKKILSLFFALLCLAHFSSCDKEFKSLSGTRWVKHTEWTDDDWSNYELSFTATHATYTETISNGNCTTFTGTYTYDPPNLEIVSNSVTFFDEPPTGTYEYPFDIIHKGAVNRKTMEIGIQTFDEIMIVKLTRQ